MMIRFSSIKKLCLSLAIASVLIFSAQSAHAGAECSPHYRTVMQNYAQAMRVQDYAIITGVQKQHDSALVLTCFDDLMGVSGEAGDIFSDRLPSADMATWGAVAYNLAGITNGIGLYADTLGVTNLLGFDIAWLVAFQLDVFLKNFDKGKLASTDPVNLLASAIKTQMVDSIFSGFGSIANYLTYLSSIRAVTSGSSYNCTNLQTYWDDHVTSNGVDNNIPYLTYEELVNVTLPGGVDTNYNAVMTSTPSGTILTNALNDFTEMSNTTANTATHNFERDMPTTLGPTSSVADVIAAM